MKKIKITLFKDGTEKLEVLGASGDECLEFTKELEERLGKMLGERSLKPEFHENPMASESEREREGEH